jgi:16S rRNA processing protein RimM
MRIEVLTDRDDRLTPGALLFPEGDETARRIVEIESGGRVPILHLDGVDTREAAEAMLGRYLEVDAEPLPPGSLYWHQIVGLAVRDEAGTDLGRVVEVFRAGENEVYRVEAPGRPDLLLPALRAVVRAIDLDAGTMTVRYEAEDVR